MIYKKYFKVFSRVFVFFSRFFRVFKGTIKIMSKKKRTTFSQGFSMIMTIYDHATFCDFLLGFFRIFKVSHNFFRRALKARPCMLTKKFMKRACDFLRLFIRIF